MSRLSRILLFTTAVAAAGGSMAIVGGADHARGQGAPPDELAAGATECPDVAPSDSAVEPETTGEPTSAADDSGQPGTADQTAAGAAASAAARRREANLQIEQALARRVSFSFKDERLRDILAEFSRAGEFPLWIDDRALNDIGSAADDTLSGELNDVTIQQALNRVLSGRGLTWLVHDEVLRVTTIEEAELVLTTSVYDVGPLLAYSAQQAEKPRDDIVLGERLRQHPSEVWPFKFAPADWLAESVLEFTSGPWEEIDGTGGTLSSLRDTLIVRQGYRVQSEVASLLEALQVAASGDLEHGSRAVRPARYAVEDDRRIHRTLESKVSLDFREIPLKSAAKEIALRTGATIVIDEKALQDIGFDGPISLDVDNVTWRSAIDLLLEPHGLTAIVHDGSLQITTIEEAESYLFTIVYDIRDLTERRFRGEKLVAVLQNETSGPWEDIDGHGGTAAVPVHGVLLVRQSPDVHEEVAVLLADLRKHALNPRPAAVAGPVAGEDPTEVVSRFYPVDPLLSSAGSQTAPRETSIPLRRGRPPRTPLERTILEFVAPATWTDAGRGGTGVLQNVNDVLVVRQTVTVHRELREFLDRLENAAAAAASLQGIQFQGVGGGLGSGGLGGGGGGGGFFRVPAPGEDRR